MSSESSSEDAESGNDISALRRELFAAIRGVRNGTVSTQQGKTIGDLAQVIVNSAKVEVEYLAANNGGESTFIDSAAGDANLPPGVTRHRIK